MRVDAGGALRSILVTTVVPTAVVGAGKVTIEPARSAHRYLPPRSRGTLPDCMSNLAGRRTWTILEAGAGEGHFAAGLLHTLKELFPDVFKATSYVIDEISPTSVAAMRDRLQLFSDRIQFRKLDEVDINTGVVFSNELLDAFPVHRLMLQAGEFREFYVTLDETETLNGYCKLRALVCYRDWMHISKQLASGPMMGTWSR